MPELNERNAESVAKEVRGRSPDAPVSSVRRSGSIAKLAVALAKAQLEMKNPPKDSVNPHFKSKYADLATVRDTVLPPLNRHGLSVLQLPCECEGAPALTSILLHDSGEWVETTIALRGKSDPQGVGSALTYMRRYTLQAIAGVAADEDDDGNAASRPHQQQTRAPEPAKTHEPPKAPNLPTNGAELRRRLLEYEAKLVGQKLCEAGALLAYVTQVGVKAGYSADIVKWTGPAIELAADVTKEFDATVRKSGVKT